MLEFLHHSNLRTTTGTTGLVEKGIDKMIDQLLAEHADLSAILTERRLLFSPDGVSQRFASYSKNSLGLRISMPLTCYSTSKSLSPVMMQSQPPEIAAAIILSSSLSRHTGASRSVDLTTSIRVSSSATAASASSWVNLNFPVNFSRNSLRMNSDVTNSCRRTQCSSKSLHTPRAMKAAMSTFVSRTIFTKHGRTRLRRYRYPALALWRSYVHARI